jgi:hypothetical protein
MSNKLNRTFSMNSVTELMVIFGFLESDAAIASYNHNGIGNRQVFDVVYKLSEFAVDIPT